MLFQSTTIFTLTYLLPLSLAHFRQQKTPFKLAILYNRSIPDAHHSFLLEEAILFRPLCHCTSFRQYDISHECSWNMFMPWHGYTFHNTVPVVREIQQSLADCHNHYDVIKWKPFSALLALCVGNPPVTGGFPTQRASDAELWCLPWSAPEQTVEQTIATPVIWDAMALIMTSL